MTSTQFRDALDRLQLSQLGAARLLGVNGRTARRWAEHGVNGPAAVLLRLLVAGRVQVEDIEGVRLDIHAANQLNQSTVNGRCLP